MKTSFPNWVEGFRQIGTIWNATFNSRRLVAGVDTVDDVIVDSTTSGIVLKSANGHYWLSSISNAGVLTWTDLGLVKP